VTIADALIGSIKVLTVLTWELKQINVAKFTVWVLKKYQSDGQALK